MSMSSALRQRLNELASSFAANVLLAIRSASLEDLLAESGGHRGALRAAMDGAGHRRGGRLPRRSSLDIDQMIERIVGLVRQNPKGMRAEEIRQKLGIEAKELPRPLKEALHTGRLAKSGQKRATTYVVKGGGGATVARAAGKGGGAGKAATATPRKAARRASASKPARKTRTQTKSTSKSASAPAAT
jgi:hypothetical protein